MGASEKSAATFHPHVGLVGAPVLDKPACQTYPTAKAGAVCGEPASLRVWAVRCPDDHPGDDPYPLDVCWPCWDLAGEGFVRHNPCGHRSPRGRVWSATP
jgi:hypothetical protein